ncbi:hypothetical protein [Paenibacillus macerans]|uniref:hypothetical protein n=1 Tax=Paenibacillus macerans TaxID=44252 RepID=UPI00204190A6|nr:hypothetical protein [Paenibacillus macerans]MCM3701485.1 hypothetical protein [Paenibacillus macerans]
MDNFLFINSVITFVETRIKGKFDYAELALATGFSLPYIRELFASKMNKSIYRYILERKIANAAFECVHWIKAVEDERQFPEGLLLPCWRKDFSLTAMLCTAPLSI